MDATISLSLKWKDTRLQWKAQVSYYTIGYQITVSYYIKDNSNIQNIKVDTDNIWRPDLEVVNRVYDYSHIDEKKQKAMIFSTGMVKWTRYCITTSSDHWW